MKPSGMENPVGVGVTLEKPSVGGMNIFLELRILSTIFVRFWISLQK